MYKKLIQQIIETSDSEYEVNVLCYNVDKAFNDEKITAKEHEQLYVLINKIF